MDTVEFVAQVSLFRYLNRRDLEELAAHMRLLSFPEGSVVRENDPADGLFIIKSGVVKVTKSGEAQLEAVLAILGSGDSFGEIGLIDNLPRSASVTAVLPLECYFLSKDAFQTALEERPEIARGMLPALAVMLRASGQWIASLL